jgi:hypothetical protein
MKEKDRLIAQYNRLEKIMKDLDDLVKNHRPPHPLVDLWGSFSARDFKRALLLEIGKESIEEQKLYSTVMEP